VITGHLAAAGKWFGRLKTTVAQRGGCVDCESAATGATGADAKGELTGGSVLRKWLCAAFAAASKRDANRQPCARIVHGFSRRFLPCSVAGGPTPQDALSGEAPKRL
jgi:hypothetical protein